MPQKSRTSSFAPGAIRANMMRSEMAGRLSRTSAGQQVGVFCDERRIAKWESGEALWPRPEYRRAL